MLRFSEFTYYCRENNISILTIKILQLADGWCARILDLNGLDEDLSICDCTETEFFVQLTKVIEDKWNDTTIIIGSFECNKDTGNFLESSCRQSYMEYEDKLCYLLMESKKVKLLCCNVEIK